jgi:hypothetical protein
MSGEKTPSKDEALEAMDFIVNILKEHEKDLDRLIGELGTITEQLGETGEINDKVKKIELKIDSIQTEIVNLVKGISTSPSETPSTTALPAKTLKTETPQISITNELPVLLQCRNWEDFEGMATGAQTLSYTFKENERTFQVNALKNNQVITYNGELPKLSSLLKMWLSKQLDVSEKRILEGELALG